MKPHLFLILLGLCLLICLPWIAAAQTLSGLMPGETRIRVHVAAPESVQVVRGALGRVERRKVLAGTFQGQTDVALIVHDAGKGVDFIVPIESLRSVDLSLGRRSHTGRGALIGLLAGGAGGVASAYIVCANGNCESSGVDHETELVAFVLGAGGAVAGTGIGALIGSLIHTERWIEKPLNPIHMGLSISRGGGIQLAVTLGLAGRVRPGTPVNPPANHSTFFNPVLR